jgi:predicted  nucleic acid-binding Zn-ribbon protein
MRAVIIEYCKQKLPNMPKGKPSRRLNRQGGRSATDKLAADIIILIKSCSSGVITSELNDIFPKQPNHGEQSLLNMTANNQSSTTVCSQDERTTQSVNTLLEEMDVKFYNLKEVFDESVLNLRAEIAEIKKDMCNKDAKIKSLKQESAELKERLCERDAKVFSLESELAAFKGNYKSNKTFVSDNLAGQKAQLQSQQVSLDKLEDKSIKLSKDFDKFKRKLNTNNRSVESAITGELTPIQLNLTEQSPKSYADMAKQSGIEIQSTIENKIVEDTTAHSGAENSVGDFNSLASKTSSNNSLNHQSQQIVQDSSVIELQNSNLSGIDSKKDNVSCEETDFVGVQNIKSSVYI